MVMPDELDPYKDCKTLLEKAEKLRSALSFPADKFAIQELISQMLEKGRDMKKIVEDVTGEGLVKLLGERVTLFCAIYIYTGKLSGVNESCVLLEDAAIVYETGPLTDGKWKDAQPLPGPWYVQTAMIESFGVLK